SPPLPAPDAGLARSVATPHPRRLVPGCRHHPAPPLHQGGQETPDVAPARAPAAWGRADRPRSGRRPSTGLPSWPPEPMRRTIRGVICAGLARRPRCDSNGTRLAGPVAGPSGRESDAGTWSAENPSASSPGPIKKPGPGGRRPGAGRPRDPESILGLRRRKLALEVRRLEIGVAVDERTKGDFAPVCAAIAPRNAGCRTRLRALPSKLAPLCATLDDPEAIRQVLADGVEEALAELAADADAIT